MYRTAEPIISVRRVGRVAQNDLIIHLADLEASFSFDQNLLGF